MTRPRSLLAATAGLLVAMTLSGCGLIGSASGIDGLASGSPTPGGGSPHSARPSPSPPDSASATATLPPPTAMPPLATPLVPPPATPRPSPSPRVLPSGTPPPPAAAEPLPACREGSKRAIGDATLDVSTILLDTTYRLPATFVPGHLVPVSDAGVAGTAEVDARVIPDLRAMARAARKAGAGVAVRSAYRSYQDQVATFAGWVARSNYQTALRFAARPGHSEHQLGTAIDFRSAAGATPPLVLADWAHTASGRWMRQHSWEYGFIESYPRGMTSETCYGYEPWHFRYVGRDEASLVHQSGMTLRRYLWATVAGVR